MKFLRNSVRINRLGTIIIILIFGIKIHGQKVKFNKGRVDKKNYYTELQYTSVKGKIIIPITIERHTYRFLLDTGAPNLITHSLYKKIASRPVNDISINDANGNKKRLQVVSIPLIDVGGVLFKDSPTIVNDASNSFIFDCFGIDGIIGSNMLRKSIVQLKSQGGIFVLTDQIEKVDIDTVNHVPMNLNDVQSSPHIWINLGEKVAVKEYVLIDTGMQGFYDMTVSNFNTLKEKEVFMYAESGVGFKSIGLFGTRDMKIHHRMKISELGIAQARFKNVITVSTQAKKSRIGSKILDYGEVTLDFKNRKFYFEPFEVINDLDEKVLGYSTSLKDDHVVIGIIWDEKMKSVLTSGDKIVSINTIDLSDINPCELVVQESLFKNVEDFEVKVTDSLGNNKTLSLKKYELPN